MSDQAPPVANPVKGEVSMVVRRTVENGEKVEKTYIFKLSMNAAAALEARTKKTFSRLLAEASSLSFIAIRTMVWLLLQKYHAREFIKEDAAGDLIDDAGGVQVFFETLKQLVDLNEPPDQPAAESGEAGDDPLPDATGGTSEVSTS